MSLWKQLGVFKTLPVFVVIGAGIEWFMINVRVGKETFCKLMVSGRALMVPTLAFLVQMAP